MIDGGMWSYWMTHNNENKMIESNLSFLYLITFNLFLELSIQHNHFILIKYWRHGIGDVENKKVLS